jgi:hypothetical protein
VPGGNGGAAGLTTGGGAAGSGGEGARAGFGRGVRSSGATSRAAGAGGSGGAWARSYFSSLALAAGRASGAGGVSWTSAGGTTCAATCRASVADGPASAGDSLCTRAATMIPPMKSVVKADATRTGRQWMRGAGRDGLTTDKRLFQRGGGQTGTPTGARSRTTSCRLLQGRTRCVVMAVSPEKRGVCVVVS